MTEAADSPPPGLLRDALRKHWTDRLDAAVFNQLCFGHEPPVYEEPLYATVSALPSALAAGRARRRRSRTELWWRLWQPQPRVVRDLP